MVLGKKVGVVGREDGGVGNDAVCAPLVKKSDTPRGIQIDAAKVLEVCPDCQRSKLCRNGMHRGWR